MDRVNAQVLLTALVAFGIVLAQGHHLVGAVLVGLLVWAVGQRQKARRRRGR